jgi:hypothetical protein
VVITITPAPDSANVVTPGGGLSISSDFVGPLETGSFWQINVFPTASITLPIWRVVKPASTTQTSVRVFLPASDETTGFDSIAAPAADTQVRVDATLSSPQTAIDFGAATIPWDPTLGLGQLIRDKSTGAGGLTAEQGLQLEQARDATWPANLVDDLVVTDLGLGNADLPIGANLTSPVFGVIVRITALPDGLLPTTPDGDYWFPSLAVVRVYRGSDVWLRVPIHTSSKLINLWIEGLALGLADAVLNAGWLLNLSLQVTFLAGVTGQVLLMRTP